MPNMQHESDTRRQIYTVFTIQVFKAKSQEPKKKTKMAHKQRIQIHIDADGKKQKHFEWFSFFSVHERALHQRK